jgi:hypothetical protein
MAADSHSPIALLHVYFSAFYCITDLCSQLIEYTCFLQLRHAEPSSVTLYSTHRDHATASFFADCYYSGETPEGISPTFVSLFSQTKSSIP